MQNYLINSRPYTVIDSLKNDLKLETNKNYLFDLSYLGILDFIGDRSAEFLQGQVSCDITKLTPTVVMPGSICNLKGRIMTLFYALQWQGYKLILPKDLMADTETSLSKSAMLSRVNIKSNDDYCVLGLYNQNAEDIALPISLPHGYFQLHSNLFFIIIDSKYKAAFTESFINQKQYRGSLAWHTLTLGHKYIDIYQETRGEFLPHRLDLHLSGYLSFNKGCYKGQEIIARTHYRATLKHTLELFILDNNDSLHSGQKISDSSGNIVIGEIIDYSPINEEKMIIAASVLIDRPEGIVI